MNEHKYEKSMYDEHKEKIRAQYKKMPDCESILFKDDKAEKRVAVYCRTAVADEATTTSSYELLKAQYESIIAEHKNWTLVDFYIDEGISESLKENCKALNRMILDANTGKIDMILASSMSRMTGSIKELLDLVIKLKMLNPPVGVYFKAEGLYTLDDSKNMCLCAAAAFAEEESYLKSLIMRP